MEKGGGVKDGEEPKGGDRRVGGPKGGGPKGWGGGQRVGGAQNFALFSLSRHNFFSFLLKCARLEFLEFCGGEGKGGPGKGGPGAPNMTEQNLETNTHT